MSYNYQFNEKKKGFEYYYDVLNEEVNNEVKVGWPDIKYSKEENENLINLLKENSINSEFVSIDKDDYNLYIEKIGYKKKYPEYYSFNFPEKTLEYYLAYKLLNLKKEDVFVDIAAEHSPHYKEFEKLSGAKGYKQDIMYKDGIRGREIGGDASKMPVDDNFFNSAFAACSLEHFENNSDINFVKEMARVLKPGGKLIILPLYLHFVPFVVTDPRFSVPGGVKFDNGIDIHCVETYQNRHGRFYSPETLYERLIKPNIDLFDFKLYYFENFSTIDETVYCRFALEAVKK